MNDFEEFGKVLTKHHTALLHFLDEAEDEAIRSGNERLLSFIQGRKDQVKEGLLVLAAKSKEFYPSLQKALDKRTNRLERQIAVLNKTKDTLMSDNILLEYKKKDLLLVTQKLEEAYEEISAKNEEMILQQKKISEQAEKLNAVNREMLEKNHELERQKESLLDQSDYLHEANQAITRMHEQVQHQKEEILKKNEELLQLNNEKNNLIGIVAHDLKSPLNQIRGILSIMKLTPDASPDTLQYITMMESSIKRLTDMIEKILDTEAMDGRRDIISLEPVDVSEIMDTLATRFEITARQKSIGIITRIDQGVFALADRLYTEQVFENLISNAIKFSPFNKKIFLSLTTRDNKVIGCVRDQGPGLSDEDKTKLFGKYQKLSARPTGNEISTGLGLSIVKKFVESMHGEIWCESQAGNGAGFFVALSVP